MAAEDEEIFYMIFKSGAKQAVQRGALSAGLPDDVSKFLGRQLAFTFDLLKKGSKLTPGTLGILLAGKTLGVADLAFGPRYDCAISVLLLATSLTKSIGFTTFSGPLPLLVNAASLLADCYSVDKSCGISDAVQERVQAVTLPAAMWLETGVVEWMSRGI